MPLAVIADSHKELWNMYRNVSALAEIDCHTTDSREDVLNKLPDAKLLIVNKQNLSFAGMARGAGYKGRVVFATGGNVQYGDYKELGVDEVLMKPFKTSELQGIITKHTSPQKRILIVEDDGTTRLALSTKIRKMGYIASTALNAEEGMEKFVSVHAVITDISQPNSQGGYWLLDKIREKYDGKQLPVVLMSSMDIDIGKAQGANAFMSKPFEMSILEKIVDAVVPQHLKPNREQ